MPLVTYRQIAHRLRIQGRDPEESERPREREGRGCYHDEVCRWTNHKHPKGLPATLIDLDPEDPQTVRLLRIGAIVLPEPPKPGKAQRPAAAAEEA